jgi:hypothetical protein
MAGARFEVRPAASGVRVVMSAPEGAAAAWFVPAR